MIRGTEKVLAPFHNLSPAPLTVDTSVYYCVECARIAPNIRQSLTMASTAKHIQLAQALPPRLTRFFARYPPAAILPSASESSSQAPASAESAQESIPSPFRAQKHPVTGKWHDPVFSLRRQADLVKLARQHGVEDLMPFSVKSSAERLRRREENGLRVKGTGVGERVKGKESERQLKSRYVLFFRLCP